MRNSTIFPNSASLLLLLLLCISAPHARAQNQTPANVASVGWTDPATGLTWTKQDNGTDVNWNQAVAYCSNLRLGGYIDWRLPTIDELQNIYDVSADVPGQWPDGEEVTWHVKCNLKLSGTQWSSSQGNAGEAWLFVFKKGGRGAVVISYSTYTRALCVRR
jgi:hypothetical protein